MTTAMDEDTVQPHEAAALGPEDGSPAPLEAQTLMACVQRMVRDKTRFEPSDLLCQDEREVAQSFDVLVTHKLTASIQRRQITGNFQRGAHDVETALIDSGAASDIPERLQLATARLTAQLDASVDHMAETSEGTYLGAARNHWNLGQCSTCHGKGRTDCSTCWGKKEETCWKCHGAFFMQCDAYSCLGGRTTCTTCSGSGRVSTQVAHQASRTQYVNGSTQTEFYTEYRTEYVVCTSYGCLAGRVQCGRCVGTGQVSCTTCFGRGRITCRGCAGRGHNSCIPCGASGELGEAGWIDIHHSYTSTLKWPSDGDAHGPIIGKKIGVHGVVAASSGISLTHTHCVPQGNAVDISARYGGELAITHLDVGCADEVFHIVAYGRDHTWHDLDGIFERLLGNDLEALNRAVLEAADGKFLASDIDGLLAALKHVAASELNAQLVETALSGGTATQHDSVVSDDYARKVNSLVLGSLRHVYTRSAKQTWWKWCVGSVMLMLLAWAFGPSWLALLVGPTVLPLAWFIFLRTLRARLSDALGSKRQAERAMAIAVRAKRHLPAAALVLGPITAACVVVSSSLPSNGPWGASAKVPSLPSVPGTPPKTGQPAKRESVAGALNLRASGNPTAARAMLKRLAESGDRTAAGPFAWMSFRGEGDSPGPSSLEADRRWVDLALTANPADPWALATRGMMMAEGQGLPKDLDGGMRLLRQSAEAGNAPAMHALGMYYVMMKNQPKEARIWFARGAEAGQAGDVYNLGLMDWRGDGAPRADRARAMELWKKAAAMGEERAVRAVQLGHPP